MEQHRSRGACSPSIPAQDPVGGARRRQLRADRGGGPGSAQPSRQAARQAAQQTGVAFTPKFFTAAEYQTVRVLSDLIIPADER